MFESYSFHFEAYTKLCFQVEHITTGFCFFKHLRFNEFVRIFDSCLLDSGLSFSLDFDA